MIPSRARIDTDRFLAEHRAHLGEFERAGHSSEDEFMAEGHQTALRAMGRATIAVQTPMERLEHRLHPWMAFAVMPLFALANAGIILDANALSGLTHPVSLGVLFGLVIGKQVGVMASVWLAVRTHVATLPPSVSWPQLYGASWLAGVGFTMSLFIAELALGDTPLLANAKLGVLSASLIAGSVGWWILRRATAPRSRE
jgi:NhaA family Na+:H+ antiporter